MHGSSMNKKDLSERDICTKFITPNIVAAGWDIDSQIREEVSFTDGRIYVRGKLHTRGVQKRVDYILYYKPNIPISVRKGVYTLTRRTPIYPSLANKAIIRFCHERVHSRLLKQEPFRR